MVGDLLDMLEIEPRLLVVIVLINVSAKIPIQTILSWNISELFDRIDKMERRLEDPVHKNVMRHIRIYFPKESR